MVLTVYDVDIVARQICGQNFSLVIPRLLVTFPTKGCFSRLPVSGVLGQSVAVSV